LPTARSWTPSCATPKRTVTASATCCTPSSNLLFSATNEPLHPPPNLPPRCRRQPCASDVGSLSPGSGTTAAPSALHLQHSWLHAVRPLPEGVWPRLRLHTLP